MIAIAVLISLVTTLAVTPVVGRLAARWGAVDRPSIRKPHAAALPSLGGLALAAGVSAGVVALALLPGSAPSLAADGRAVALLGGAALLMLVGAYDDLRPISAWAKLAAQLTVALLVVAGGLRVTAVGNPLDGTALQLGWFGGALSVLWIVTAVNAFNLIDGLDGLCVGVTALAGAALAVVAGLNGQLAAAGILAVTAGAALGFLRRNSYPASVFLGDSGSMMLGFLVGAGALWAAERPGVGLTDPTPILLAAAVPLADLVTAVLRRVMQVMVLETSAGERERFSLRLSGRPHVFTADRRHVHHRLLDRGYPHRTAVAILWGFTALTGAAAVVVTAWPRTGTAVLAAAVGLAAYLVMFQLRYQELGLLRRGLLLPLFERPLITRRVFHPLVDLMLAAASYAVAYLLVHGGRAGAAGGDSLPATLPVVAAVELGVFYLAGLYRGAYRHASVGEALRVIRAVVLAAAAAAISLALVHGLSRGTLAVWVMNGLLLLTLLLGSRVSFRVLDYLRGRGRDGGVPTLLYGAGRAGDLALRELLGNPALGWCPVGFIDDHPGNRGRYRGGYPVLGGLEDLPDVAARHRVRHVVITTHKLTGERRRRLLELAGSQGLSLTRFGLRWQTMAAHDDARSGSKGRDAPYGALRARAPGDGGAVSEPIALDDLLGGSLSSVEPTEPDGRQERTGEASP